MASWLSVLAVKETYRKLDGTTLTGEPTNHVRRVYLLAPELWLVLVYEWFGSPNVNYTEDCQRNLQYQWKSESFTYIQ